MQQIAKRLAAAIIIAAISAATAADELTVDDTQWSFFERTDEVTDEVSYIMSAVANESIGSARRRLFGDETRIVIQIKPKGRTKTNDMKFDRTVLLYHTEAALGVDETRIITRFDREKATSARWATLPPNYKIAVSPDSAYMFKKLQTSTNLIVRFTTIIGETNTLTFDVRGLTNALHAVKLKYLATNPPTIPDAKPSPPPSQPAADPQPNSPSEFVSSYKPPPPCKKCKGKGIITGWVNCPGCGGNVMSGGSRCKKCIYSIHVGKVRGDIPCPVCHSEAAKAKQPVGFGAH